jgi:hypothetical protein
MVRKNLIIVIFIVITVLISVIIFELIFDPRDQKPTPDSLNPSNPPNPTNHIFIINYSYQNPSEWEAINVSENLDYENILNIPRYDESWGCPNFIDTRVINDLIGTYDDTKENYDKWFEYRAKAKQIKNSTLRYSFEYETVDISIDSYKIISNNERVRYEYFNPIIARNSPGDFEILNNSQNLIIKNLSGIFIEMSFSYGYNTGGGCGCDSYVKQILILDKNFNPIYVIRIISWAVMA